MNLLVQNPRSSLGGRVAFTHLGTLVPAPATSWQFLLSMRVLPDEVTSSQGRLPPLPSPPVRG
jgi:hypothetical protein